MSYRLLASRLLVLAGLGIVAGPVAAADLDPAYGLIPPQEERVEFGTGLYVRGDIGATKGSSIVADNAVLGNAPNLVFNRNNDVGYVASLGGGYQFNKWFRTDAVFDFRKPVASSGPGRPFTCDYNVYGAPAGGPFTSDVFQTETCNSNVTGSLKSYDVLLNGYFDLGTWHSITPYVGAGVGLSFGHYQSGVKYYYPNNVAYNFTYTDPVSGATLNQNFDRNASGTYYNVAFALMAGIAVDVFDHTKLDIGYRYVNLGRVLGSTLSTQEVRAGLRYMIDN